MIKIENTVTPSPEQWHITIMGARNAKNSWDRSDSGNGCVNGRCGKCGFNSNWCGCTPRLVIGPDDMTLLMNLRNAGTPDHRKYLRMLTIHVEITAPLYWWKEFDTYKVGTVANSCSTMHKIQAKEFVLEDFSTEHLFDEDGFGVQVYSLDAYRQILESLNTAREAFLATKDKRYWWQMIQLLPSSYNQKRTVMLNYEVAANIYKSRYNHKQDEWRELCKWLEGLPYSELITGKEAE